MTALVAALAIAMGGLAAADTVYNTIDSTVDTTLETVNFAAGATAAQTVTLRLTASTATADGTVTDPQAGCNLGGNVNDDIWQGSKTGDAALKLTAASADTAVATVTSPAAFTKCANETGSQQTMNVTPVRPGTTTVTFAIDSTNSKWRSTTTGWCTKAGGGCASNRVATSCGPVGSDCRKRRAGGCSTRWCRR